VRFFRHAATRALRSPLNIIPPDRIDELKLELIFNQQSSPGRTATTRHYPQKRSGSPRAGVACSAREDSVVRGLGRICCLLYAA